MKKPIQITLFAGLALLAASCCGIKSPENSPLFEKTVDPESGVVSYSLRCGSPDDNNQSLYFVTKSMTEDGRFLVFQHTQGNERIGVGERHLMLADLCNDDSVPLRLTVNFLYHKWSCQPFRIVGKRESAAIFPDLFFPFRMTLLLQTRI